MNANELADEVLYRFADSGGSFYHEPIMEKVYNTLLQVDLAESIIKQQQAEIEALKAKLNKYHLKEDLDRNLNLIYGKELLK